MSIENAIHAASQTFVSGILAAVKGAMIAQVDGLFAGTEMTREAPRASAPRKAPKTSRKAGRLARRSPEEIAKAVTKVASFLKKGDARAEQIKAATGLSTKELPRVLKQGVADKAFKIVSGAKRSTTYGVGGVKAASKGEKVAKTTKKPAKAKARASAKRSPKAKASPKASSKGKAAKGPWVKKPSPKAMNGAAHAAPAAAPAS